MSKCPVCNLVFSRKEHLVRHQRAHSEEAPFQCATCNKRFRRQDVLHRHVRHQCYGRADRHEAGAKKRTTQACNRCRGQKLKCSGTEPCQRCTIKSIACSYLGGSDTSAASTRPKPDGNVLLPPALTPPASAGSLAESSSFAVDPGLFTQPEDVLFSDSTPIFDLDSLEFWPDLDKLYDPFFLQSDPLFSLAQTEIDSVDDLSFRTPPPPFEPPQPQPQQPADEELGPPPGAPQWLSTLCPNIQFHDPEIINYFLSKFARHIAPMMPTFDQEIGSTPDELPERILAMAAVGGLYSPIEGSWRISLALHTDARRLAMSRVFSSDHQGTDQAIHLAETFMCLEIFGLCSGDPRAFECTEAQHMILLQTIDDYGLVSLDTSLTSAELDRRLRLIESLYILESYHVLLLRRPAQLSITTISSESEALSDVSQLLSSLMNPHAPLSSSPSTGSSPSAPILCLTLLAAISSNTSTGGAAKLSISWKTDLLELGLHRWLSACQASHGANDVSTMTLYHLVFINIRTDLELVHKFAKWHASPAGGGSGGGNGGLSELQTWRDSESCEVACLHARQLMEVVKKAVVFALRPHPHAHPRSSISIPSSSRPSHHHSQAAAHHNNVDVVEVPHLATGVYMATLVLWTAAVATTTEKKADWALGRSVLENGILVLGCFGVRVAGKLGNSLRGLSSSPGE